MQGGGGDENGRLLFLGLGLALSRSGQLNARRYFDFLTKIDISEEDFFSIFRSFDDFLDDLSCLEKRIENEKGES